MSKSQQFMGSGQLLERLTSQIGDKDQAIKILIERGHMTTSLKWTPEGVKRNAMTAADRAKDRASKETGLPVSHFKYDPKTNKATKR